jgi:hypothetical protein
MTSTIESVNTKISGKIDVGKAVIENLRSIVEAIRSAIKSKTSKKYVEAENLLGQIHCNLIFDELETIENNYCLAVVSVMNSYYSDTRCESKDTQDYYRIIASENFSGKLNCILDRITEVIDLLYKILSQAILPKRETREYENQLETYSGQITSAKNIEISSSLEKRNYEVCKCGARMGVVPELSELVCPQPSCGKTKKIVGAVFRDDQFYPQEGQKTKHGGYDELRHYKFWTERLQALENATFKESEIAKINYVIDRDGYSREAELNCEIMRDILKDSAVSLTTLNDHAPLLVKTCGGRAPPQFNFQENKILEAMFILVMKLYDEVNPEGGNKPYYPYFIYKLVEFHFAGNEEKLRLLDYIHLQSRETVIKNDIWWEMICERTKGTDHELIYTPTDPAGRL